MKDSRKVLMFEFSVRYKKRDIFFLNTRLWCNDIIKTLSLLYYYQYCFNCEKVQLARIVRI